MKRAMKRRMKRGLTRGLTRRLTRGLTLIELVIALAVLAVLGTLAVPAMGSMMERHRLRAVAEELVADLTEARFLAAQGNAPVHLQAAEGPAWCYAVARQSGCGCDRPQPCQLQQVRAADHPGITLLQARAVQFAADGTASAGTVALFEARSGARLRVDMSVLGRARLCAPQGQAARTGPASAAVAPC